MADKKLGVNSTPTFFINGDKHPGEIPPDQFEAIFAPYLK
jgi:protein-disulfide isomerase